MGDAPQSERRRRVAVVFQGDASDPRAWSGVPHGLSTGLAEAGFEPVPIDARMPGSARIASALRMSWIDATTNPAFAAAGGLRAEAAIRAAADIDAALIIGSGFSLRDGSIPTATFDDMTVVQAMAQLGSEYAELGERQARRWRRRQRRNYDRVDAF